jgi:hypothetical protein
VQVLELVDQLKEVCSVVRYVCGGVAIATLAGLQDAGTGEAVMQQVDGATSSGDVLQGRA